MQPGLPGYDHPSMTPVRVHIVDILGQINAFVEQLQQTELIALKILITTFEKDFGPVPFPSMIGAHAGDLAKQQTAWLKSSVGRQKIAETVEAKIQAIRAEGNDPSVVLSVSGVRTALKIRQQQLESSKNDILKQSRCPSGKHGIGEGPCDFVGGGTWGK